MRMGRTWVRPRPLLFCTDGVGSYRHTIRAPVRPRAHGCLRLRPCRNGWSAQVVKCYAQRRFVDVEHRRVDGTSARVEPLRRRAHGDGVLNPASVERLNKTWHERLASLTHRGAHAPHIDAAV